jgi:hypothetical protein
MASYRDYLEFASKYLNLAKEENTTRNGADWLLIPATVLAWSAIEAFINNMFDDFTKLPDDMFELHERAFLQETRVRFVDTGEKHGFFELDGAEYRRLEDKIAFLIAKFSSNERIEKGNGLWQDFARFKQTRDNLVHPRRSRDTLLTISEVAQHIDTAKSIIQYVSKHVWKYSVEL